MAKNNRHNAAFVVGSILGAVVGAGAALWKTPYTGHELREKLAGGKQDAATGTDTIVARPADSAATASRASERSLKDKVLSGVEKTLAPIVGVELGKTANGNGAKVVTDPNMKVNTAVTEGSGEAASTQAGGTLGLSKDRVDAEKWAAAYSGTSVAETTPEQAASTATSETATESSDAGTSEGGSMLRHPHRWHGYGNEGASAESTESTTSGDTTLGLSRDRVDPNEWAAAYSGEATAGDTSTSATTSEPVQDETTASSNTPSSFGSTLMGQSRDQRNADRWASAYAGSAGTSPGSPEAARESAEQTGQGAAPAFRGDDGDAERHPPVDRGMSENVAPATTEDTSTRDGRDFAVDAASTEQLTTPQVHAVPDAVAEGPERGMHPFPKLGGKE